MQPTPTAETALDAEHHDDAQWYAVLHGIWCGQGAAALPADPALAATGTEELRSIWQASRVDVFRSLAAHLRGEDPILTVR